MLQRLYLKITPGEVQLLVRSYLSFLSHMFHLMFYDLSHPPFTLSTKISQLPAFFYNLTHVAVIHLSWSLVSVTPNLLVSCYLLLCPEEYGGWLWCKLGLACIVVNRVWFLWRLKKLTKEEKDLLSQQLGDRIEEWGLDKRIINQTPGIRKMKKGK